MKIIDSSLNLLNNTPWLNFVYVILTIVSIILAIIFYFRSRRLRKPAFAIRNVNLIKDKIKKIELVEILFQKQHIDNLSIARIAIWNDGDETIRHEDVALVDPIRIETIGNVEILEAKIVYEKQEANKFILDIDSSKKKLIINFDYFDRNEGIILQIFHTGQTEDELSVNGTIKGFGKIQKIPGPLFLKFASKLDFVKKIKRRYRRIILGILLIITPIIVVIGKYIPQPKFSKNKFLMEYLPLLIIFIMYWSMGLSALKKRIPKGFELFEDEIES